MQHFLSFPPNCQKKNVKSQINVSITSNSLPHQVHTWQEKSRDILEGADSCDLHGRGMSGRSLLETVCRLKESLLLGVMGGGPGEEEEEEEEDGGGPGDTDRRRSPPSWLRT